eukprot:gene10113-18775_t
MTTILAQHTSIAPKPLNSQFESRISKEEAKEKFRKRSFVITTLNPPAQQQKTMMEQEAKKARGTEKKKTRKTGHCRTCGETMLGHSKQKCVSK